MDNFSEIIKQQRLLYEYIRGSYLYNLNCDDGTSDIDKCGIFINDIDSMLGFPSSIQETVSDKKQDEVWFEIGKFYQLLAQSNPTAIEALYVPSNRQITLPHKHLFPIFENKDKFLTQEYLNIIVNITNQDIQKVKKIHKNAQEHYIEKKNPLTFACAFVNNTNISMDKFLNVYQLSSKYCAFLSIPNIYGGYYVFYDWGAALDEYHITYDKLKSFFLGLKKNKLNFWIKPRKNTDNKGEYEIFIKFLLVVNRIYSLKDLEIWYEKHCTPLSYQGFTINDNGEINTFDINNDLTPICHIIFQMAEYKSYLKQIQITKKRITSKRYNSTDDKIYDSKKVMHCMRLLHMGVEVAEGQGLILPRTTDRVFLLNIKNHEYGYEEILDYLEDAKNDLSTAIKLTNLPQSVDKNWVQQLLIEAKKNFLKDFFGR